MPTQVLISHPNWFRLMTKKEHVSLKVDKFEFLMEFTKHVMKMLNDNPVFQAKLWDAASKQWKLMLKDLNDEVDRYQDQLETYSESLSPVDFEKKKKQVLKGAPTDFNAILTRHQSKMAKAVDAEWARSASRTRSPTNSRSRPSSRPSGAPSP